MGNNISNGDSDDDREFRNMDESSSENEDLNEKESQALTDLDSLFKHAELRTIAAKIKEDIPENVIQQHRYQIIRWLDDREAKSEETVTLAQFCDMLMNKPGVSREDAIRAFQQFDTDGSGVVEVSTILSAIKYSNGPNMIGELGKSIRMLQACSLTPGFVDVYSEDKNAVSQHAERILKYLLRNRAPSHSLPFPHLNGFNNTSSMRLSVLKNTFNQLKDVARGELTETSLSDGEEVKLLNPCYNSLEVSSNNSDAHRLSNGLPHTFWQSDGAARSHFIRLHLRNNVVIKNLSINVASADSSYMPEHVTITAGRNPHNLREIKDIRIPSSVTGDVILLKNAKCHYPMVQINIKRCRNDGCDTRIHGVKAVGYKVVKEPGISVSDSAAVWFLQVLASTVTASIPLAPVLQKNIIEHSKNALEHIPPLSLSPACADKPGFLTKLVLQEVEKFITDVAVQNNDLLADGVHLLLAFNLARGHIGGLLRTLKILQEHTDLSLPCTQLMAKMQKSRDFCWEKSGHQLQVTVAGCDGGNSEEHDNSKPENVLTPTWTDPSPPYLTAEGKTKVNMFFKSAELIQLTRLKIKVVSGVKGAKRGLVFVYRDKDEFNLEKHVERFDGYDTWGKLEYQFSVQVRNAGIAGKPDNPVAYFTFDDDCDEIEVPVSWHPIGQYVLVKFLEPRKTSSVVGVAGIKFSGFIRKPVLVEDQVVVRHPPNPEKKQICTSLEIIQYVTMFLIDLSQDLAQHRSVTWGGEYLDFSAIPLDTLCEIYHTFRARDEEKWQTCSLMTLQLIFCLLPAFTGLSGESKVSAESLFQHLCKTVDDQSVDKDSRHYRLCRQLIIDGAAVFFSDKEARKKQLFSMMQKVETLSETPSVMLVFQSLCQFFSSVDPRGLLDLPKNPSDAFDPSQVLEVMETMVMVTFHEFSLVVKSGAANDQLLPLLQLVSSLQTSLLAWTWWQASEGTDAIKVKGMHTATTYAILVAQRATEACKLLQSKDEESLKILIPKIETSFLGSVVRQMVLLMTYLCPSLSSSSRVSLLQKLQPLNQELMKLAALIPDVFPTISSTHWQSAHAEDIVLRTWEVESAHNYENNVHYTQVFSCPGATKFIVEFDSRCETERRYDYLVFTDAKGQQMRFDQKVGSQKWPKQIQFMGPHIHFLFHSDSSNTEWGYKFKVTARGSPDMPLSWPFDLQLGLTKLVGRLCGATLNANPVLPRDQLMELEEAAEQDILRSELWTTLFRGGYMIGKLQRSLSGRYASEDTTVVLEFLWSCFNGNEKATEFLHKCKESSKVLPMGGENVSAAVLAVFCALVWHTQQLREDLEKYLQNGGDGPVSDGLCQAFTAAETLRPLLVQQRQKIATEHEGTEIKDEDNPATICKQKALYLLKFAGLTKTQLKQELSKMKLSKQMKKLSRRGDKFGNKFDLSEKFPSFRLVLEFVQDQAWSTEKVHNMLQERTQHAQAVADVYMISTELIRMLSEDKPFQILIVLFLQEMLSFQDGFARHYAEGLDGCGLEQEAKVRHSFYTLIRRLTDAFHKYRRHDLDPKLHAAYDYIQGTLLHLLDIHWQPYDLNFISDVKLPALFSMVAKETVKMRDCRMEKLDEAEELKEYTQHMKWFDECSSGSFVDWYKNKEDLGDDEKKAVQMFIARFCDLLEVEVNCDGCNVTLPGRRYRCLQCIDMDLCATCYAGGVEPEKHTDEHDIIHLVYKCNKCQAFIVGTRIHCNECEDFDLCLGCHLKGNLPPGHSAQHSITKFHQMKLKTSQETDSLIQAYIHQHVWMLFTLLAISMGDIIYNTENGVVLDHDYTSLATHLQNQCISITTHCLQQVPDDEDGADGNIRLSGNCFRRTSAKSLGSRQNSYPRAGYSHLHLQAVKDSYRSGPLTMTTHLQNQCISITTHCLQQVPDDEDENLKRPLQLPAEESKSEEANTDKDTDEKDKSVTLYEDRSIETRQEEAFSIHSQERFMGLLGAMIPHDTNAGPSGSSFNFMTAEFLKLLFKISRGESGHEVNTRHLAMGLLGLLLTKCPVKVADSSVDREITTGEMDGCSTIKYLFTFGASCLEKSGLEWSCSVARILQRLYNSQEWKLVLHHHLTECVQNIAKKPELSSIFAMFVMAGFPEVLTTGTLVTYNHTGMDHKRGVVLKHYPDKHTTLLVDVKTRKRHTVPDKYIDCVSMTTEVWDSTNIVVFVNIVKDIADKKSAETVENVENLWVLSLALKLLHNSLQSASNCCILELYAPDFIQCLVSTASKGTGFSQQWLLKDLEVLSLMLYTHEGCTTTVKKAPASATELQTKLKEAIKNSKALSKDEDSDSDESLMSDSSSSISSGNTEINIVDELDMFHELDEKTQLMFRILRSDLNLPISVLKVIYDMNDRNPDAVVKAILENFEGVDATPKEIIKKLSEKWDTILQSQHPEAILSTTLSEKVIDTGIHYHPSLKQTERKLEKATEETAVDTQKLIQCPDNDVQDEIVKQRRTKSADLLKKELEKHGKTGTREYLAKVNMAMSVLYARQVLTSLLAHWPAYGHVINSDLLGCKEVQQIPCVLDLLYKTGSRENFQKVVQNLVHHCEKESLVPIARTACQFMEEVTMSVITKESQHNYKTGENEVVKEKIQLPGASFLTVNFDSKCSTREQDVLMFSSTSDMQQNNYKMYGSSRGVWNSFQVPGDTIYYEFETELANANTHWGYKFTVTAGTRDSFETGYIILNDVLTSNMARCLPLSELWTSLVYVASKQTGTQRLKTIQLLLKIVQTQHRDSDIVKLDINLGLLKPLWQLYNNMTKQESEPTVILPPVSRALTELFLQVENLAIEWNMVNEYLVLMQDISELKMAVSQGIQRIAAVSLMIGHKNLATELTLAALRRKKSQEESAAKSKSNKSL